MVVMISKEEEVSLRIAFYFKTLETWHISPVFIKFNEIMFLFCKQKTKITLVSTYFEMMVGL